MHGVCTEIAIMDNEASAVTDERSGTHKLRKIEVNNCTSLEWTHGG